MDKNIGEQGGRMTEKSFRNPEEEEVERWRRLLAEDLSRSQIARVMTLLQLIAIEATTTLCVVALSVLAVYLMPLTEAQSVAMASFFVPAALGLAAKGGFMLHRKWGEFNTAEKEAEARGGWRNPSIHVQQKSKLLVGLANGIAIAAIPVPLLCICYYRLFYLVESPLMYTIVVTYSLALSGAAGLAWIKASQQ